MQTLISHSLDKADCLKQPLEGLRRFYKSAAVWFYIQSHGASMFFVYFGGFLNYKSNQCS